MHRSCAHIGPICCLTRHSVCVCVCVCLQAVQMQAYLLRMLGSGGALYELYSGVLTEPGLTIEELVDYSALQSTADTMPAFCDKWDAMHKPPLNPAQLLGVSFDASREQVSLCLVLACKLSSVWTVAWQHFRTKTRKEQKKGKKGTTSMYLTEIHHP